jgi:hypothetical protein
MAMAAAEGRRPERAAGEPLTGWIQWGGGPCPVGTNVEVEIVCRDGQHIVGAAGDFTAEHNDGADWWTHSLERPADMPGADQSEDDIVRYRLLAS